MRRTFPLQPLLIAGLLVVAGCGGKSYTSRGGVTDETPPGTEPRTTPPSEYTTPPHAGWDYDVAPAPAPSKKPSTRLNEVAFEQNDATLDKEGHAVCRELGNRLKGAPAERVLVVGFSHHTEKDAGLGLRRAERVRDSLLGAGVARARIEVASFGSQLSTPDETDPLKVRRSRSVEIWLLSE